ncbi:MAG: wax ester/triacylglycerol synthase family O-acyltransferase [Actinobacteria bacterium]|nr:wax ester/triacylglycerol synthase family O-acyltransferase [Actinomycetota bacterium]
MERLPIPDAGWLLIEQRERPMHVGGLQLFRLPEDAPEGYLQDLVARTREEDVAVRPPFDKRLARPHGLAGVYHWVDDQPELDYHFRHLALPAPGRVRELLAIVSAMHANLLDRHRPLWESYLFEGLEDRRFALYTKVHHSMLDGVAAMQQLTTAFSHDPDERDMPPPWAAPDTTVPRDDGAVNPVATALGALRTVTEGVTSSLGVTRAIATQLLKAQADAREVVPFSAPSSMLNVPLTGARRFVAQDYDLSRIKQVGKSLEATVNDVVLTMCSSALRTYLLDHGALPRKPLIALVPVAFGRDRERGSGNAITLVPANLATHLEDPADRLDLIQGSMERAKSRVRSLSDAELVNYGIAMTAPIILGQLTGLSGKLPPAYNVVISNLPGPTEPLYWNGARMSGLYPLSLLTEGYAINITQTSYAGDMEFGITADRNALPGIQRLIDHLADALDELEEVAGIR